MKWRREKGGGERMKGGRGSSEAWGRGMGKGDTARGRGRGGGKGDNEASSLLGQGTE